MSENKNSAPAKQTKKEHISAGDIKGKLEVTDKRERRDGPGGN